MRVPSTVRRKQVSFIAAGVPALALLLGLGLAVPAAAQPAQETGTYKVSPVFEVRTRSAIAATGADIFEVGHWLRATDAWSCRSSSALTKPSRARR